MCVCIYMCVYAINKDLKDEYVFLFPEDIPQLMSLFTDPTYTIVSLIYLPPFGINVHLE